MKLLNIGKLGSFSLAWGKETPRLESTTFNYKYWVPGTLILFDRMMCCLLLELQIKDHRAGTCNPSYLGGWGRKITSLNTACVTNGDPV